MAMQSYLHPHGIHSKPTAIFKDGDDAHHVISLNHIEDELTYTQRGKSFIDNNDVAGKEVEMLKDILRDG